MTYNSAHHVEVLSRAHIAKHLSPTHDVNRIASISDLIVKGDKMKYAEVLPLIKEIVSLSNMACYFGFSTFYEKWSWGYVASKPPASELSRIGAHKVYPDGRVTMKIGGKWIVINR